MKETIIPLVTILALLFIVLVMALSGGMGGAV